MSSRGKPARSRRRDGANLFYAMKRFRLFPLALLAAATLTSAFTPARADPTGAARATYDWSRDEFQFTFPFDNPLTKGGAKSSPHSTVYLYIPVTAKKVRALLLLQQNVIEQMISVHPAIRRVCDADDVAIAWCSPGFDLVFKENPGKLHELIQEQFRAFGRTIGYPELGDAPLIAFGHSNTTAYAQNGAEARPDRVLAVLATHGWNGVNALERYRGPELVYVGTYWEQRQQTLGNGSNKGVASLAEVQKRLQRGWRPISIVEEYGSGHFDYSEPVVDVFAMYIDKAIEARLAPDGTLKDLRAGDGCIAEIPAFPTGPIPIQRYAEASPAARAASPWYFDREMAEAAVKVIEQSGPWNRATQLIGFERLDGTLAPFSKSGPVSPAPYRIVPGTNELQVFPVLLTAFPAGFKEHGRRIERSSDPAITLAYDCGPYIYRDAGGRYRVKLNRNGFGGYLVARSAGDARVRPAVQGARFVLAGDRPVTTGQRKEDGAPQVWPVGPAPIENPGDQKPGATITLPRRGSATQFHGYYVDHGPARVVDGVLEILPLPANTPGPVEVKLTSYLLSQTVDGLSSVTFHVSR